MAAITLPTLIQNYQKRVTVEKLKTSYSLLTQTFERAKIDYGTDLKQWDSGGRDGTARYVVYNNYFKPYLDVTNLSKSVCPKGKCNPSYKALSGGNVNLSGLEGSFYLKNGAFIWIRPFVCGVADYSNVIYIDINGPKHGPNILGKDTFDFVFRVGAKPNIERQKTPLISACEGYSRDQLKNICNKSYKDKRCGAENVVSCCAELIKKDGWQISKDYPW